MMGDRDYGQLIKNVIESIGKELEYKIDPQDIKTIHIHEVTKCLRRSFFDRLDPIEIQRTGFTDLVSGLLQKLDYGVKLGEFKIEEIRLVGQGEMIVDDAVIIFRSAELPPEVPKASDILYLNSCLWIYGKVDGIIIYITQERKEISFSLTKDKKMFEEVVRRVRVLYDLLKEKKPPILEPSGECSTCQYYQRCFIDKRFGKSTALHELFGIKKN